MQFVNLDISTILILFLAFALGGIVKGATGAGSPIIAIPVLTIFFDAKLAVAVMAVPNLFSNVYQIKQFRNSIDSTKFSIRFAVFGALGCLAGSIFFVFTSTRLIELLVAAVTILYVTYSLTKNSNKISQNFADKLVALFGIIGGFVQGTCGVSAPIALAYLNAIGMKRNEFIFTISCFFGAMAAIQLLSLSLLNFYTTKYLLLGTISILPLTLGMPIGEILTKNFSVAAFEKLILIFLIILSIQIVLPNLTCSTRRSYFSELCKNLKKLKIKIFFP